MVDEPSKIPVPGVADPQQERSRATLERIVAAAKELIAERGHDSPSIADITRRAGCSVGGFYARFQDRDALYRFIDRREFEESTECWRSFLEPERWEGVDAAGLVRETLRAMETSYRQGRGLLRALILHWRNAPPRADLRSAAAAHYQQVYRWYASLLAHREADFSHPEPERAAAFILRLAESVLVEWVVFSDSQLVPVSEEEIRRQLRELEEACLRYLGVDEPASTGVDRGRRPPATEGPLI